MWHTFKDHRFISPAKVYFTSLPQNHQYLCKEVYHSSAASLVSLQFESLHGLGEEVWQVGCDHQVAPRHCSRDHHPPVEHSTECPLYISAIILMCNDVY